MNINNELKRIKEEQKSLAQRKKQLLEQQKQRKAAQAKLTALVKQSGFDTPKALVEALIEKYHIRLYPVRTASAPTGRRKHTKVTPELRDQIKARLKDESMNRVSKDLQISYAVIAKVANGAYDKLV